AHSGNARRTIDVFGRLTHAQMAVMRSNGAVACTSTFAPDGKRILISRGSGTDEANTDIGKVMLAPNGDWAFAWSGTYSPDGKRIVTGNADGTAQVWDAVTGRELFTLKGHKYAVSSVALSPDGTRVVTGSWDETAKVWDVDDAHLAPNP